MNWFENQIEERRRADDQLLEDSLINISGVVLGNRNAEKISDERIITKTAIDEILKYYHYKPVEMSDTAKSSEQQLDYCLAPYGIMRRNIELSEKWYKDAYGPILAFTREDGFPVALLPRAITGYQYIDPATEATVHLNSKNAELFSRDAICFYRPLPQKKLTIPDLLLYMKRCISINDFFLLIFATLAVTLISFTLPRIIKLLTGSVLTGGHKSALMGIGIAIISILLSTQLMESVKELITLRLSTKTSLGVQSSMMMRMLSLPADFFKRYSPGELRTRSMSVNQLCDLLFGMVMGVGLTSVMSLLYITQIFNYAPALVVPSLLIILITVIFSVITVLAEIRIDRKKMKLNAKESGMSYSLITGVQKIKLAGAEKRAFSKWLNIYAKSARLTFDPPMFIKINTVITTGITLFSNIILYYLAARTGIDQSSYFAFAATYGMLSGAFLSVSGIALSAASIRPILEMAEPFLKTVPETAEGKEIVKNINGGIELDHVFFRYNSESPYILEDLSLKIRSGEYVAIVGKTGCGKSTLVRLLLGFEKPEKGAVNYDGKNIDSLDLPSLRKKIGTVMQEAGLFQGDIYSNIVISAPELTVKDAWEAAEKAGIADDIKAMPMGMNTMIGEGQGGISGGQRQRIMIARAIAPGPKLLIFDEATSALDNKTQKQVSDALDAMKCTRVVIAHRLSTIRHCDRILVLDGGRIIEDGTYEQLIEAGGFFAELVDRQRLDTSDRGN